MIIAIDIAALQSQYWNFLLDEDLVEETAFKTIDYTNLREYYVFTKKSPFRSFQKKKL